MAHEQYLTYQEYIEIGGTMPEEDFDLAEFKARSRIDWLTLARVQRMATVPVEVKKAMMVIMKVDAKYSAEAQANGSVIHEWDAHGYHEAYGAISVQMSNAEKTLNAEVLRMLFGVCDDNGIPLIYKGVG